jgi:ankyrin repeat protein
MIIVEWSIRVPLPNNAGDGELSDLLRWASQKGNVGLARLFLVHGADVNTMDDLALRLASQNGHVEVVKVLLARGANVHADNGYALRYASQNRHVEVVQALLAHGANS